MTYGLQSWHEGPAKRAIIDFVAAVTTEGGEHEFGNSDGDHQMLQWTAAGDGLRFCGLVHHTDAQREWAYDRGSPIGGLDKAWDEALERGWSIVDMKEAWKRIFP